MKNELLNIKPQVLMATINDRDEILFLWNEYILRHRFKHSWEEILSHVFNEANQSVYENCAIIKDNGKIVAAGCLVPMTLRLAGIKLDVGVLTGIVTHPQYRRKGFMDKIVQKLIELMQEKDLALGLLWGYRDRYKRFGFEICGKRNRYFIPKRKFSQVSADEISKIREFSKEKDRKLVDKIACVQFLSLKGAENNHCDLFCRGNLRTFIYDDIYNPALIAINIERPLDAKQLEVLYMAGDFQNAKRLLDSLMFDSSYEECVICGKPDLAEDQNNFYEFYEWFCSEHICNVRINNFQSLMQKLQPLVASDIDQLPCAIKLSINNRDKAQCCSSAWVGTKKSGNQFFGQYTDIQMVRLLFGPERPSELPFVGKKAKLLNSVFPLSFYISAIEGV